MSSPKVAVDTLSAQDPTAIREVACLELAAWGRPDPAKSVVDERVERLTRMLAAADPGTQSTFVARVDGVITGLCRVKQATDDAKTWALSGLAVASGHRRRGIGRQLASACVAFARAQGGAFLVSETHETNADSVAFHIGVGFSNRGRFTAADGDRKVAFQIKVN